MDIERTMHEVRQVVREVVAEETDFPVDQLTDTTKLEELSADSLDRLNIMFEIEKRLDVSIRDQDLSRLETIGDMCCLAIDLKRAANA